MHLNPFAWAIPLFLSFMLLEYWYSRKTGKNVFNFIRSVSNINIGIAERLLDVFVTGMVYFLYEYLHRNYALFEIRASIPLWIILLIFTDFVWYWYHRFAHEVNIFWSVHVVHHQSEDFNYTISARITIFQAFVRTGFWAVLPLIGFPPQMITTMLLVHGTYPFFTHTRLIGKLGWLEYFMVTPSHHRVHHAINPKYIDKNYGDVFIIWDKLFGTFQKEEEEPEYGLTHQLQSQSFLWQHFHYMLELFYTVKQTRGLKNKLRLFLGSPQQTPEVMRDVVEKKFGIRKNTLPAGQKLNRYVIMQVVFALTAVFFFTLFEKYLNFSTAFFGTVFILLTLINCGAILEQRRWIFHVEYLRFSSLMLTLLINFPHPYLFALLAFISLTCILYYEQFKRNYLKWVYPPV